MVITLLLAGNVVSAADLASSVYRSGLAKLKAHNYRGSIVDFTRAIKLNPKFAEAFSHRGHANLYLANKESALEDANTALALNLKLADAYLTR